MDKARIAEVQRLAKQRAQQDEERRRKEAAREREDQAHEVEAQGVMIPAEAPHYAHLPRPSHTGIR